MHLSENENGTTNRVGVISFEKVQQRSVPS